MLRGLLRTDNDITSFILRLFLGVVIFPHGAQKVLGIFGGDGFKATISSFEQYMGIPWYLTLLVMYTEFFGSIFLIFGFLTRINALGIATIMGVATYMVHWKNGFFMNWNNTQQGEGFEYHLLAFAIAFVLMIKGGGRFSADQRIAGG